MADQTALYQGQANALYDPQLQASQGTAKAGYDAGNIGYGVQTTATNNSYAEALKTLTATEQGGEAHNNMNAEVHGLFNSGLAANANRLTYAKYQDNVNTTSNNRAAKLAGIAASQQGSTLKYNAELGALASKYQGDKASYVSGHVNADQKAAQVEQAAQLRFQQQEQLANERANRSDARAAANASQKDPSARDYQSGINGDITAALNHYSDPSKYAPGTRETVANQIANTYGISIPEAQKQVFAVLNDSWDSGMQEKTKSKGAPLPSALKFY